MSSGFIPMVSTTPPPIDNDDDFGDFVDNTEQDDDDFGDFSSHVNEDEDSYSPMHSPPDIGNSMSFPSDDDFSPTKISTFNKGIFEIEKQHEKESVLQESIKTTESHDIESISESNNHEKPNNGLSSEDHPNDEHVPAESNGIDETCENANGDANKKTDSDDWLDFREEENDFQDISDNEALNSDTVTQSFESNGQHIHGTHNKEMNSSDTGTKPNSECPNEPSSNDFGNFTVNDMDSNSSKHNSSGKTTETETQENNTHETSENTDSILADENVALSDDSQGFADFNDLQNDEDTSDEKVESQGCDSDSNHFDSQEREQNENNVEIEMNDITVQEDIESENQTEQKHEKINSEQSDEFHADFADFQSVPQVTEDSHNTQIEVNSVTTAVSSENAVDPPDTVSNIDNAFECDFAEFEGNKETESEDQFADFSNLPSTMSNDSQKSTVNNGNIDSDFGDFSTASNDDDFGDFSSGSAATIPVKKELTIDEKVTSYVSKYTKRKDDEMTNEHICLLDERMNTDVLSKNTDNHLPVHGEALAISWPGELWDQLEDIDNTIALNFIWNGSGHNKLLLDSLGMHTQNILFSGSKQAYYVPTYYAAGLGLVDMNKGVLKPMSAAEKITAMSPTEKGAPTIQDELFPEAHPEWNSIADGHASGKSTIVDESGSWTHRDQLGNNSTFQPKSENVGDSIPIISSTMDLDYFDTLQTVQDGVKMPSSADLIDPELLELATAPTTEPPPPPKDSGTATLSKILASIKNTSQSPSPSVSTSGDQGNSKWEEEEKKLSPEARAVLQKLPDISYMSSKVLVFPMNMSRVNIGEDV